METLPFEPLELVAIDPARNIRRRWQVMAAHDLFGQVLVETRWGRIGSRGQQRVHSFADESEALRYVRALLARRGTAQRRLGVGYVPQGMSEDRTGWRA
jgi:predicted DNA-binding WGR domain protein